MRVERIAQESINFKTEMLQSNLCDYSDAYRLVEETITVVGAGGTEAAGVKNRNGK